MEEVKNEGPVPLQNTYAPKGQTKFLFAYALLDKPHHGIVGRFKFLIADDDEKNLEDHYRAVYDTNKSCTIGWGETGHWEVLRTPDSNTEGPVKVIPMEGSMFGEDDDFMGEKVQNVPVRQLVSDPKEREQIDERIVIDHFKAERREIEVQKKKNDMRRIAMEELQKESDDPESLASYSQLQYQRLAQKSRIDDLKEQMAIAQKELSKTVTELASRTRRFPHYRHKWQVKLNDMKSVMTSGRHTGDILKDVDTNDNTDSEYITHKTDDVIDEFSETTGIEAPREKYEETDNFSKEAIQERALKLKAELDAQRKEFVKSQAKLAEVQEAVAKGFMPGSFIPASPEKKKKKDKKGGKKKKDKKGKK
jgi:hypothetical protein